MYRIITGEAYNGSFPITVYWVQVKVSGTFIDKWINIKGYEDKKNIGTIENFKRKINMKEKYKLEPFDFERAKAGEPVCTRGNEEVKILCFDRKNSNYPIVALIGSDEKLMTYTPNGKYNNKAVESSNTDLMMKVEIKEPYVYADVAGEIWPFDELKSEGFVDLKSLDSLIIKTHDGKFLKIWKKNLPEEEWKKAQVAASEIGKGWRCPTRHECIDLYDARFNGLDDAMKEIGGDILEEIYWTSETDSDPQYSANSTVYFSGNTGCLYTYHKSNLLLVRPVCLTYNKENN